MSRDGGGTLPVDRRCVRYVLPLANEHFSADWGDVDELKSIVRKISRI